MTDDDTIALRRRTARGLDDDQLVAYFWSTAGRRDYERLQIIADEVRERDGIAKLSSGDPVPTDYMSAMCIAMLWATGKRSWWNTYAEMGGYGTPEGAAASAACATADAAEVEKWCAVARAFADGEALELAKKESARDIADQIKQSISKLTTTDLYEIREALEDIEREIQGGGTR